MSLMETLALALVLLALSVAVAVATVVVVAGRLDCLQVLCRCTG